jgi:hypothetical protein
MGNTWLKVKVWTRFILIGALVLYLIAFILLNRHAVIDKDLDFVFKTFERPNALLVLLLTAIFSIFGWWLIRTVFKTARQLRDVRRRAHLERVEREHADMLAKAAKLQTKPVETQE